MQYYTYYSQIYPSETLLHSHEALFTPFDTPTVFQDPKVLPILCPVAHDDHAVVGVVGAAAGVDAASVMFEGVVAGGDRGLHRAVEVHKLLQQLLVHGVGDLAPGDPRPGQVVHQDGQGALAELQLGGPVLVLQKVPSEG